MRHTFGSKTVANVGSVELIHTIRVLLDPTRADGLRVHVRFEIDGEAAGLFVRHCVAVPTDGHGADVVVSMSRATLVAILSGRQPWSTADVRVSGDRSVVDSVRACFDHDGLRG